MRTKEEIFGEVVGFDDSDLIVELLLDIRDELVVLRKELRRG